MPASLDNAREKDSGFPHQEIHQISADSGLVTPMDDLLAKLRQRAGPCLTGEMVLPAFSGNWQAFPEGLDNRIKTVLRSRGISSLYSHQLAAWKAIQNGSHAAVVTPTASGKTLCYNLPVIQAALESRRKALYLFPTKALSQDQVAELLEFNQVGDLGIRAHTFDGDTPGDARKAVRLHADIVVSNPDMLHQGILPHHTKWAQFFENLHYVVIDEMHIYRGVFGSHMANLLRRLKRICRFYGCQPQFIFCSATIANPAELARRLLDEDVVTITENGAPSGRKHVFFWNPPVVNADLGVRASARSQTTAVVRQAVRCGLKSIIFAQSRLAVEVITKYLKDQFDKDPRKPERIKAYRGGYLPTERRRTEKLMRSGDIDCVVATSALELGVDIGSLDVSVLNGYPGTVAATWQRLGRAGRRHEVSLGVLVANSQPLDQYLIRNPDFFTAASPEHAHIDPEHLLILLDHIRCAAFELSFQRGEQFGGLARDEFLDYLQEEGVLHQEGQTWHWVTDAYPANSVNLRSVAEGNFVVIDTTAGKQKVIAEVDFSSASLTLYEGAIYMIQAQPWQVEKLDWEGRKAFVTKTRADYYTDAIEYTRLKILDRFEFDQASDVVAARGEVHLVRRVSGFKKIRYYSHENVGYGKVNLPDQEMHTTAVWWQIHSSRLDDVFTNRWTALDGFLGAAYALHHVSTLLLMSSPTDIGRAVGNGDATWFATVGVNGRGQSRSLGGGEVDILNHEREFSPTLFLYDNYSGGIGLSAPLYELRHQVVIQARDLISHCQCKHGCPACIGPILTENVAASAAPKQAALIVLNILERSVDTHGYN